MAPERSEREKYAHKNKYEAIAAALPVEKSLVPKIPTRTASFDAQCIRMQTAESAMPVAPCTVQRTRLFHDWTPFWHD